MTKEWIQVTIEITFISTEKVSLYASKYLKALLLLPKVIPTVTEFFLLPFHKCQHKVFIPGIVEEIQWTTQNECFYHLKYDWVTGCLQKNLKIKVCVGI